MSKYRLILKQATLTPIDKSLSEAQVVLSTQDKTFSSTKQGQCTDFDSRVRLVVEATLDALHQSVTKPVKFEVSGINIKEFGNKNHKFLVVFLKTDYFIQPVGEAIELLGACQLDGDDSEAEAAARAALDATNRTVSSMLGGR